MQGRAGRVSMAYGNSDFGMSYRRIDMNYLSDVKKNRFNPSSHGTGPSGQSRRPSEVHCHAVSILLLMELGRQVDVDRDHHGDDDGFNPSSHGTGP